MWWNFMIHGTCCSKEPKFEVYNASVWDVDSGIAFRKLIFFADRTSNKSHVYSLPSVCLSTDLHQSSYPQLKQLGRWHYPSSIVCLLNSLWSGPGCHGLRHRRVQKTMAFCLGKRSNRRSLSEIQRETHGKSLRWLSDWAFCKADAPPTSRLGLHLSPIRARLASDQVRNLSGSMRSRRVWKQHICRPSCFKSQQPEMSTVKNLQTNETNAVLGYAFWIPGAGACTIGWSWGANGSPYGKDPQFVELPVSSYFRYQRNRLPPLFPEVMQRRPVQLSIFWRTYPKLLQWGPLFSWPSGGLWIRPYLLDVWRLAVCRLFWFRPLDIWDPEAAPAERSVGWPGYPKVGSWQDV